jgi:murein DD-endopeptidase MepM/ murein hydrolase activator NlpD
MIFKFSRGEGLKNKIISLFLCLVLVSSSLLFGFEAFAKTKTELEADIKKYDEQIKNAEGKLDKLKENKKKQEEYLTELEKQIEIMKQRDTAIQTQINSIDAEIADLTAKLRQLRTEISIIEEDIEKTEHKIIKIEDNIAQSSEILAQRLRTVYMQGEASQLKILMGADSLASFLTKLELMKRTSERDKKIIVDFRDQVLELEEKKTELEKSKEERDIKKTDLDIKKEEATKKKTELKEKQKDQRTARAKLQENYNSIDALVKEIDKSSAAYKAYISKLEKDKKSADAEIDKILKEYYATSNQQTTTLVSGGNSNPTTTKPSGGGSYNSNDTWAWPIGTRWCYISSKFGYRDPSISGWGFHGGIDLAGGNGALHGAPVYATRAGRVITAVTSDSGYGIYVLIDHGDGYSSLYAHMSVRYVSTGDTVAKGQMIGRVGDTGNSRKAHLHFEVRYYGEKKDPLNYVKNPN